jgi:hypothetical protein
MMNKITEYTVQVDKEKTQWFLSGVLHRADGPAIEYSNGDKSWYLKGVKVTEQAVMKPVKKMTIVEIEALLGHRIQIIAG